MATLMLRTVSISISAKHSLSKSSKQQWPQFPSHKGWLLHKAYRQGVSTELSHLSIGGATEMRSELLAALPPHALLLWCREGLHPAHSGCTSCSFEDIASQNLAFVFSSHSPALLKDM
ncbi:unnamed protein product [Sphagnum troendelagicum]